MRRYRVTYEQNALNDLDDIQLWIADKAGVQTSEKFARRLLDFCDALDVFPLRGTSRDDLLAGVRSMAFEKAVTVFFRVGKDQVAIVRIVYRGRNLEDLFYPS